MNVIYKLLSDRALSSPEALSLANSRQQMSFSQLLKSVDQISLRLSEEGVGRGELVAVSLPAFENWMVTLALAKIGALSWSLSPSDLRENLLPLHWRYLIAASPGTNSTGKTLIFESTWAETGVTNNNVLPSAADLEEQSLVRAISTSGTSGNPKLAVLNHRAVSHKLETLEGVWGSGGQEFNFMPLSATGGFSSALMSLVAGRPYLAQDSRGKPLIDFLVSHQVRVLTGSPDQIAGFITKNFDHLDELSGLEQIRLAGSHPGAGFIARIRSVFDVEIVSVYGSTETGAIFSAELGVRGEFESLGELRAGCQARVVDERGIPVPIGKEGFLETKSSSMFSGYLTDSEMLTVSSEEDWFATGDRVKQFGSDFVFLGRESGVLNIGGVKIDVGPLEQFVQALPGIDDALSFHAEDKQGTGIHVMALVSGSDDAVQRAISLVNELFPAQRPHLFWRTTTIDRVGLEKPARWQNRERFDREYFGS